MDETLLIRGASVVTLDASGTVHEEADILLRGGVIAAVGASAGEGATGEVLDGRGLVAMPGFANCHTHSYSAFLKGSVDTIPLDVFMVGAILGAGSRSAEDVYVSAKLGALEMLLYGTTACLDHFSHRPRHTPEALEAVCRAYGDAGVRAAIAPMFSDLPFAETIPLEEGDMDAHTRAALPGTRQDPAPFFEMMSEAIGATRDNPYVDLMLGVDSPQRCSDELLALAGRFCADHGIGNHTHLLEAKTQWAMAERRAPGGFVRALADRGLAGPRSSFAHFIWFTDEDLEAATQSGVGVVHNPISNLALGSGLQPLLRLIDAGVPVAFGSDGLNVGHMSMFEKVRLAALLPRVCEADPDRWPRAHTALAMATVNGARILGREGRAGTLEEGQLADIVLLAGDTVALSPRGDVTRQILLNETGAGVRHVLVGGKVMLRDREPTRFDAAALIGDASERAARLMRDNQRFVEELERFRPGLVWMVRRVVSAEAGPCRIAALH